jgi:hypothetical protein
MSGGGSDDPNVYSDAIFNLEEFVSLNNRFNWFRNNRLRHIKTKDRLHYKLFLLLLAEFLNFLRLDI